MKTMNKVAFSARRSAMARDNAIAQVEENASDEWMKAAYAAVVFVAKRRARFTTDAVWFILRARGVEDPAEPRAMGPLLISVVRDGVCERTDEHVKSVRVACHTRPIRIYLSNCLPKRPLRDNKRMPL